MCCSFLWADLATLGETDQRVPTGVFGRDKTVRNFAAQVTTSRERIAASTTSRRETSNGNLGSVTGGLDASRPSREERVKCLAVVPDRSDRVALARTHQCQRMDDSRSTT